MIMQKIKHSINFLKINWNFLNGEKTFELEYSASLELKKLCQNAIDYSFAHEAVPVLDRLCSNSTNKFIYVILNCFKNPDLTLENKDKLSSYFLTKSISLSSSALLIRQILRESNKDYYAQIVTKFNPPLETKLVWLDYCSNGNNWPTLESQINDLLLTHPSEFVKFYLLSLINEKLFHKLGIEMDFIDSLNNAQAHAQLLDKTQVLKRLISLNTSLWKDINKLKNFSFTDKETALLHKLGLVYNSSDLSNFIPQSYSNFLPILAKFDFNEFEVNFLNSASPDSSGQISDVAYAQALSSMSQSSSVESFIKILNKVPLIPFNIGACITQALSNSNFELAKFLTIKITNTDDPALLYPSLNSTGRDNVRNFAKNTYDIFSVIKHLDLPQVSYFLSVFSPNQEDKLTLLSGAIELQDLPLYHLIASTGVDFKSISGERVFDLIKDISHYWDDNNQNPDNVNRLEILKDIWIKENNPAFYLSCHEKGLFCLPLDLIDFLNIQLEKNTLYSNLPAAPEAPINQKIKI